MSIEKIDQLNFGGTAWDIDLPSDATPSILSLTLNGQSPNLASFKLQADSATDTAQTFNLFMPHDTGTIGLEKNTIHYITGLGYQAGISNSTASKRQSARWYIDDVDGITQPYDGMKIAVEVPGTGVGTAGTLLNINGSTQTADWHPVVYNINTALTTHYGTGAIKMFIYDTNATMANCMITKGSAVTITGVWKAEGDYNTNTTSYLSYTSTAVSSGTDKHYFIGKRTAASTGTNYYNANLYFLGAGQLYAPDVEVSDGTDRISIIPASISMADSDGGTVSLVNTPASERSLSISRKIDTDTYLVNIQPQYITLAETTSNPDFWTQMRHNGFSTGYPASLNTFDFPSGSGIAGNIVIDGTYPNANTTFASLILGTDGETAGSTTVLTIKTNVSQPIIEFSSGVSGNGGRLKLFKATGTYDANVTFPSTTGILVTGISLGSTPNYANSYGYVDISTMLGTMTINNPWNTNTTLSLVNGSAGNCIACYGGTNNVPKIVFANDSNAGATCKYTTTLQKNTSLTYNNIVYLPKNTGTLLTNASVPPLMIHNVLLQDTYLRCSFQLVIPYTSLSTAITSVSSLAYWLGVQGFITNEANLLPASGCYSSSSNAIYGIIRADNTTKVKIYYGFGNSVTISDATIYDKVQMLYLA